MAPQLARFVSLVSCLARGCLATCPPNGNVNLVAHTVARSIIGHIAANTTCVVESLGIPYAAPPTGKYRFMPPHEPQGDAAYKAEDFGADCPLSASGPSDYPDLTPQAQRIIDSFASGAGTPQSEDCLTLNIWSGPTEDLKPVLVFFHGGRFAIGNTNSPFYTGKYLAEAEDLVVVTVNYRLNIFGFPGAPGEAQNLGLLDQRAAVEWLRDNIEAFGGDPAKITVSGQSSGGVAVDYWSYAFQDDPIIHGIIATSGNAFSFPVNAPDVPERNWITVVDKVGCGNSTDVMKCMQEVHWEDIKEAAAGVPPSKSSSVLRSIPPFYPMPDERVVFSNYLEKTEKGDFGKIPVLMGHNENEDGYYRLAAFRNGVVPTDEQAELFLLESFTCPVSFQARARRVSGVPSYAYRFFADWNNTRLFSTSGAYHGVDLHMLFGASEDTSGLPTSEEQRRLTRIVQRTWASFCEDPSTGLTDGLEWPLFDPKQKTLAVLGRDNVAKVDFLAPSEFDAPCSSVTMGALATAA